MHPESVGDHVSLSFDVWRDEVVPIKMYAEVIPVPASMLLSGSILICPAGFRKRIKK